MGGPILLFFSTIGSFDHPIILQALLTLHSSWRRNSAWLCTSVEWTYTVAAAHYQVSRYRRLLHHHPPQRDPHIGHRFEASSFCLHVFSIKPGVKASHIRHWHTRRIRRVVHCGWSRVCRLARHAERPSNHLRLLLWGRSGMYWSYPY
jgi:hypothetical protein